MKSIKLVYFLAFSGVFFMGQLHADMVSAITSIKQSLVIVGTYKSTNSPRFSLRGTGFVVGNGNWVITNSHVLVQSAEEDIDAPLVVQVKGPDDWQMRVVTVLEVDKLHDLALLQFDGPAIAPLRLRDSASVQEGQSVAFMGFPIGGALGFSPVTHRAMVSSIADMTLPKAAARQLNEAAIRSLRGGSFSIFQLDGTAYPGNSGGPLFDPQTGDVLGVINMVLIKGVRESALTHPSGISYAIPSTFVQQLMQRNKHN